MEQYYIYILSNKLGTLYTGVTNNLEFRLHQHRSKSTGGFTAKYGVNRLVYYETTADIQSAIEREKQIKSWRRSKKVDLIKTMNPNWRDLSDEWGQ